MQSFIHVCVDCMNQLFQVDGHVERSWQSTNYIIEISCVNSNNILPLHICDLESNSLKFE